MQQADILIDQLGRITRDEIPLERRRAIVRAMHVTAAEDLEISDARYAALLRQILETHVEDVARAECLRLAISALHVIVTS